MAFYRLVEIPHAELREEGDVLGCIRSGEIHAVIVKGLVAPERAEAIAIAAEGGALSSVPRRKFAREFEAYSLGPCLDQAEHGLDAYFEAVPAFARAATELLGAELEQALQAALASAAGELPVELPHDAAGRPYGRFTLRCLPPGGLIPPHAENEQLLRPPYEHLRALLDPTVLLSFYLTLRPAETGGELRVHALGFDEIDRTAMLHRHSQVGSELDAREHFTMKPLAGDLLLFDGGRHFHQVLPVGGDRNRWTLGGFLAFSADGRRLLSWA